MIISVYATTVSIILYESSKTNQFNSIKINLILHRFYWQWLAITI